jgi:hypothetical protein
MMQVVWHFRHDAVALLTTPGSEEGSTRDTGKSEGGFFNRRKVCLYDWSERVPPSVLHARKTLLWICLDLTQ